MGWKVRIVLLGGACFFSWIPSLSEGKESPFHDAVAVWHLADWNDSAGKNSALLPHGNVQGGVELSGDDREASIRRGGDGRVAVFQGGYLSAGQGEGGELNLAGKVLSLCLRVKIPEGTRDTPLFSKHGGHGRLVYNLFCTTLGRDVSLGFELGSDFSARPLQVSAPAVRIGLGRWHDVLVRYSGAKLELFIDGVLVDEEWPVGSLRQGNPEPCLLGAESHGGGVKSGFRGLVDHAALWSRPLEDEEIQALSGGREEISLREREILGERNPTLQYWRPRGHNANVGDCMPFFHDGTFHLFYLFDRRHHGSKWGLGAHQWAHASTTDLIHWTHHPLAIAITEEWEGSICTGSVFFHDGIYYAHYATRKPDRTQHLGLAVSTDGIHFKKTEPNPFASPGKGYNPRDYRDPTVFQDPQTGQFHLLVTASLTDGRLGCLAQLVSKDLKNWKVVEPFLVTGYVPECPDFFFWNGWYYLISTRYKMSRTPLGPWTSPKVDTLDVMPVPKTAAFTGNRRIYASWLADGGWGGDLVFRELIQNSDGTLGAKFLSEVLPDMEEPMKLRWEGGEVPPGGRNLRLKTSNQEAAAVLRDVPQDAYFNLRISPEASFRDIPVVFGLRLRASSEQRSGCELRIVPQEKTLKLGIGRISLNEVEGLDRPFRLEVILKGDIVDVCLDRRRTIIRRIPGHQGDRLVFFASGAEVVFESIQVHPLSK